jgi:integrase
MREQVGRAKGGRANIAVERLPEWQIVNDLVAASLSRHTRQIYQSSQRKFEGWCSERQVKSLPAQSQTVAMFLASEVRAGIKPATLVRHLAAIRRAHLDAGAPDPTAAEVVRAALRGARRVLGTSPVRKRALTVEELRAMARGLPKGRAGVRDRAILLLGFAGALRRSELAALRVEDIDIAQHGMRLDLRRSKTDQEAQGQSVFVPRGTTLCPVRAVQEWLRLSGVSEGILFRRMRKDGAVLADGMAPHTINRLIKTAARRAGLQDRTIAGHSLRAGFLTAAALRGASVWKMMQVSRHRSVTALQGYVRDRDGFRDHAGLVLL